MGLQNQPSRPDEAGMAMRVFWLSRGVGGWMIPPALGGLVCACLHRGRGPPDAIGRISEARHRSIAPIGFSVTGGVESERASNARRQRMPSAHR